jgi:hypothetical protein
MLTLKRPVWLAFLTLITISACTRTSLAVLAPMNQDAQDLGVPHFEYTHGPGASSITVVMPSGETLTGSYRIAQGAAFATAFGTGGSASALALSGGGNFFASATGPHTTLVCQGNESLGHGGGTCRTQAGALYQIQF